tara:strand:- start:254 stop:367 length:114 start_codon:yes stop_codon:yes gene_type:complete
MFNYFVVVGLSSIMFVLGDAIGINGILETYQKILYLF